MNNINKPAKEIKKNKYVKWFWILGTLLALSLGYIGYGIYHNYQYKKDLNIYQQGAQFGYNQAIIKIVEQVSTCKLVPINYKDESGNHTINILMDECL